MEQKNKRIFGKLNIVDFLVLLLILAVGVFLVYKRASRGGESSEASTIQVQYTVKCEDVDKSLYENCQKYLPSQLMASGVLYDGQITGVTSAPYYVLDGNGQWVEDPEHVNLLFTVQVNVPDTAVMTTKVGDQEVRVGKSDYILKSEYIEFDKCVITNVTWDK